MSFPGPNQPPSNGGGNKPNGGNNPFTNPFSRNNDGKNGGSGANGNKSNGPRPFWQSPWLWVVVVALLAVTMFQLFAGAGSQTIDTKDGLTTIRQTPVEMAREAARMTLALIEKQPLDEPFKTFPAQLIVRSTTARLHS